MTRDETLQILAIVKANWYMAFSNMTKRDAEAMVNLWTMSFAEYPLEDVQKAVIYLINTKRDGFPPQVAQVKECLVKMQNAGKELTPQEAWAMVSKACKNGIYGYKKEFAKLPPAVQAAVGSAEQLRDWAMMDEETVQSVIASNFQRSFTVSQKREAEVQMLPESVRGFINAMSGRLAWSPDALSLEDGA